MPDSGSGTSRSPLQGGEASLQALIVFAKVPEPNQVKTRLTSLLSPEWAARLYEAFLLDAFEVYTRLPVDVRLYFSANPARVPAHLAPNGASLYEQRGADLGRRMAAAFAETFLAGYERAVIIGTDHPTLPTPFIEEAFFLLEDPYCIAIGPSDDGGYYLLGMNEFYPLLFQEMTYSHARVFEQTLARAGSLQANLHILPRWYDVDTPESLRRLVADLEDAPEPLQHTRGVIEQILFAYPELAGV
jgi:rSAM/selenodomain-associated transferase 1